MLNLLKCFAVDEESRFFVHRNRDLKQKILKLLMIKYMAITIKSIPILERREAERFIQKAESSQRNSATINFSEQVKTTKEILNKAKML